MHSSLGIFCKLCRIECELTAKKIEYIYWGEFTKKKCKTAILFYCFYSAGVLHIFVLYNLLAPGISFYRKSKINTKENQIMK